MAREVVYTDDISGEHGAEPVKFGWDEIWWEIDLADDNRGKLLEALQPYLDKAHPATVARMEPPARARGSAPASKRVLTIEDYGFPRRGRVSAEEAEYVRNNLDEVNKRLKAAGVREIDPTDQKLKDRFGL